MLDYSIDIKKYNQNTPTEYQPDLRVDHCNSRLVISEKLLPKLLRAVAEYVREDSILILRGDVDAFFTQSFTKHASTLNELADRLEAWQEAEKVEFDLSDLQDIRDCRLFTTNYRYYGKDVEDFMEAHRQEAALKAIQDSTDLLAKDALDSLLLKKSREEIPELLEGLRKVSEAANKSAKDSIELYSKETLESERENPYVEALCEAADKTLPKITHHHSATGDKRFEGALPEDPTTKQRKSLGRAIIDLLNTKFK